MEQLNQANHYIYQALEKLLDISKYDSINEEQRKEIYDVIDDIEEAVIFHKESKKVTVKKLSCKNP